jgi:hypothetical protein
VRRNHLPSEAHRPGVGHRSDPGCGLGAPQREWDNGLITPLEEALEEERTRLMLANSVLGCLQTALDPEAVTVTPPAYFPEVLELARQFINKSVRHLEYEEIRRLMHCSTRSNQSRRAP